MALIQKAVVNSKMSFFHQLPKTATCFVLFCV
jgi:hypothetical protein